MKRKDRPNVHLGYEQSMKPYHEKVAKLVCEYSKDDCIVLDIGCGVGHTLAEIQKRKPSIRLVAADIDPVCLDISKQKVDLHKSIHIKSTEGLFDLGVTYDAIIMSHVLEHTYRPLDVIKGIFKILHPDGIAVLAVPNPVRLEVFIGNIFKWNYVNRGHVYAWDRSHWINFLENIDGLEVVCYSYDYFPLRILGASKTAVSIEKLLAIVFPWLAFSNIAVVKKSKNRYPK